MRFIGYILLLIFGVACESSLQEQTPELFLKKRFPHISELTWDSSKPTEIAVFFSDSLHGYEAYFERDGRLKQLYSYLMENELPQKVQEYLSKRYPNGKISVGALLETPRQKSYTVELAENTDYIKLELDLNGRLLNESKTPLTEEELRALEEGVDDEY